MRRNTLFAVLSVAVLLVAASASAQTLVAAGPYSGGEGSNQTDVIVDEDGYLTFTQICMAGATTEPVAVDGSGNFSAAGQYGNRPHIGPGFIDGVDVHFIGHWDAGEGTLDIYVVEDSTFDVLAHVVVSYGDLISLPICGETEG